MKEQVALIETTGNRLLSLDVMRGLIMLLLAGESCLLYESLHGLQSGGVGHKIVEQFFHHPWNGLRFWDLVQPAFMTIAGTALCLSYRARLQKGISWKQNFRHVAIRCLKLFICGVGLHCIYAGRVVWELWNVLTQLSVTTMIAYLIIRKSAMVQLLVSIGLLLLTEILYRSVLMPGFDHPFVESENFGSWMDTILMGKINRGGWVTINIIPTAAHTIWGVLAGKLLIGTYTAQKKIKVLVLAGVIGLVAGYALDVAGITPIIKRIATSSFVLASGGWVLLMLAFFYWLTDIRKMNKYAWIFAVMGMNAIFIYLFFESVGIQWLNGVTRIFVTGAIGFTGAGEAWIALISALVTLFAEWYLCYWLYKRKIYFKL